MDLMENQERNGKDVAVLGIEESSQVDAWPFGSSRRKSTNSSSQPDANIVRSESVIAPNPGCDKDAEEYYMGHPRRGVALIFNHQKFDRMNTRTGTAKDCVNLAVQLKELGFEVRSYDDLKYSELSDVLRAGHYSWRNPRQGSWFIQALCEELRINGQKRDLLTMMTFVCRRVAIDYQSFVPDDDHMDRKKQIPSITSMLTRLVYFRPKK
ncbi:hypothetical protein C0J52_04212 [Blattella germanica]|nr:hypothetical protein C0J52_04212 [Blattella germanica]